MLLGLVAGIVAKYMDFIMGYVRYLLVSACAKVCSFELNGRLSRLMQIVWQWRFYLR